MKEIIKSIEIEIAGQKLSLSPADAENLHAALSELLNKPEKVIERERNLPYPFYPYPFWQVAPEQISYPITVTCNTSEVSLAELADGITRDDYTYKLKSAMQ